MNKYCVKVLSIVLALCLFLNPVLVLGLSANQKRVIDSGVLYFDVASDNGAACAPTGSSNVRYPANMDVVVVEGLIRDYISKTRPDSPLVNFAKDIAEFGKQYDANPAMVTAMAQKETSLGTAGYGLPPKYNITNLRPGGSFASYSGYREGIEATYKNLAGHLYLGPPSNFTTVDQIITRWAPPSENATAEYIQFVNDVIQKILGGGTVNTSTNAACTSGDGSGLVNPDGYSWPVAPQKKSENGTIPGLSAMPCNNTTCHHDNTPALDLGRQPGGDAVAGAPLYAIGDGHVENVNIYQSIEGCYSLQLQSSKNNMWYWYGHIQNVSVKDGDTVKAGQQIAEIGLRKCTGNGSTPHLHIDRGCVKNGVPQKGGRDSCRDPDFIPFMNHLFESLPA